MSRNATLRPDIARAGGRMSSSFGGKREMRELVEHLDKGEIVEMLAVGWYGKGNGLVALTNHRSSCCTAGFTSSSRTFRSTPSRRCSGRPASSPAR